MTELSVTENSTLAPRLGFIESEVLSVRQMCRNRNGYEIPAIYNSLTCAYCFLYVFADYNVTVYKKTTYGLLTGQNTAYPEGTYLQTDINNSVTVSMVCGLLRNPSECWKWKMCCQSAQDCCKRQLMDGFNRRTSVDTCPPTWDGYACWPETVAGQRPQITCPSYVPHASTNRFAYKTCTHNATWFMKPKSTKEWTDYTNCFTTEHFSRLHTAGIVCNAVTIALLVPACIIFIFYRPLRQQHRIRLHLCLMSSSFLTAVCLLLWEVIVFKDRLESNKYQHDNSAGCRLLFLMIRYAEMTTFMWMFTEGFHLHRLLVRAFSVPKTLLPLYIFGFGFPTLPVTIYALIRATNTKLNQNCWIERAGTYEWILAAPTLAVLGANVVFLLRIVFIMVRQLEPHPNEPSNFRRAVKAVVVLVPLFGIQFLFFIYRPEVTGDFEKAFELLSKIICSLQGSFVAIVFCYFNKEVRGYLKTSFKKLFINDGRHDHQHSRSYTLTTHLPQTESSRTRTSNGNGNADPNHMILLQPVDCCHQSDTNSKTRSYMKNGDVQDASDNLEEDFLLYNK